MTSVSRRITATSASLPTAGPKHRQQETVAEIWPEKNFRKELSGLLKALERHCSQQGLNVSAVRIARQPRFLLRDRATADCRLS